MSSESSSSPAVPGAFSIVGLGTDIVEIVRIGQMIQRHGERFLTRVYTSDEIQYCQRRKQAFQHFAGRWAAKEAVLKTLGTGFVKGIGFVDVEIRSQRSGAPVIVMHGGARDFAESLGIDEVLITMSHCRAYATATAIAVRHVNRGVGSDSRQEL